MRLLLKPEDVTHTSSRGLWPECGRKIPPIQKAAPVLHGSEMTKHEACCLWHCADMFHSVRALQHIGTISHGPPTLGKASGNFRGSADSLYWAFKKPWPQMQPFPYCKIPARSDEYIQKGHLFSLCMILGQVPVLMHERKSQNITSRRFKSSKKECR